jgi:hypothetical protein
MYKVLSLVLFLVMLGGVSSAQVLNGRFVTSIYGWERTSTDTSTSHLRAYENIQLNFGNDDISFHTYMQGSTDFDSELADDPRLRLFNAYINVKNVADMVDVRVGRQSVYAGVNYGSIDGALLRLRPAKGVEIVGYGGGITPPSQKTDFFNDIDNNWQAGAQALFYLVENMKFSLSYMNRHRATTPFEALRVDPLLGNVTANIDYGSRANQYGSFNLSYLYDKFWFFGRYDYDFNFEKTSRAEFATTYQALQNLGLSLSLAHREPTIAWNSYFAILEMSANQEAVLGIDYKVCPRITLLGRFSAVKYNAEDDYPEDENINDVAYRIAVGAAYKYASVMYTKDVSVDGDLDGLNFELRYPLLDKSLIPHAGIVYSNYALANYLASGEAMEKTSTLAAVLGAMYRPIKQVSIDVQGQYMTNKIYKSDMRAFLRINYWFNDPFGFTTGEDK